MESIDTVVHAWFDTSESLETLLVLLALSCVRIMTLFSILPATNDQMLTGIARNGVVYALAILVAAGQPVGLAAHLSAGQLFMLTCKEIFLGACLGFAASTVFWVAETAGTLIDNVSGFNNVQMTNPLRGDQNTPIGNTLVNLAVTLFYAAGGMLFLLGVVFESFKWWPLGAALPDMNAVAQSFLLQQTDSIFSTAVKLAAPVMMTMLLIDAGIGLLARAADKLEPTSLGQPIKGAVALLMVMALVTALSTQVKGTLTYSQLKEQVKQGLVGDGTSPKAKTPQ
ncbi:MULTISPECIES: type III secretion system export apparatus subunit SctT [Ralstonia solanacearum species complex]|uniref:EscT/YscT/HrcT family type III secretion system export apparatus protein n=5 Tax=Ralstonia solanacearum species complex TaxID=3116862 RepID=A0A0K1ZSF9_RALSL|nr:MULTISPECIES: type III secretion system export apparatus subunit SctT [Ralstonia]AKZ28787.1 type III secretion system protein [Ralstonia solanacearum]APF89395.1 EscT/YscT/HrcT family type III secretion system export apparatus protein [Ralstonia solanacearum FJAT-1458]ARS59148.1 EscT/YscT/HrcT family type III secretion system export apparatus protein [Ralstonia solanacearum FJAT-91]ESS47759.1 Hrp HRCT transmembrane protein [Ralstonia solanacearum SD54]AGH86856.1 Type III secretion inner memb